jgi:hypothetical protein
MMQAGKKLRLRLRVVGRRWGLTIPEDSCVYNI